MIGVPRTQLQLPYTIIAGASEGKTILITAGIHGSEYVGIETAKRLAKQIDCTKVHGKIIIFPLVNQSAFENRLCGIMDEDGNNLNRMFPGSVNGTVSQRLAHFLLNQVMVHMDFYMDLHSGDLGEVINPLIFYPTKANKKVSDQARQAAEASGFSLLVASAAKTGAYNAAAAAGTPSILMELGGCGRWNEQEVSTYTESILRILSHLDVYPAADKAAKQVTYLNPVCEVNCEIQGFWYPLCTVGNNVGKGQIIGEIRDIFDKVLSHCYSPVTGMVLYHTVALSVKKNDFLAAIASIAGHRRLPADQECSTEDLTAAGDFQ